MSSSASTRTASSATTWSRPRRPPESSPRPCRCAAAAATCRSGSRAASSVGPNARSPLPRWMRPGAARRSSMRTSSRGSRRQKRDGSAAWRTSENALRTKCTWSAAAGISLRRTRRSAAASAAPGGPRRRPPHPGRRAPTSRRVSPGLLQIRRPPSSTPRWPCAAAAPRPRCPPSASGRCSSPWARPSRPTVRRRRAARPAAKAFPLCGHGHPSACSWMDI
mmetsp:Transcript_134713/g.430365  ORF Transcript_134713/g.430365 Transcript_134713/m.430365 type:complete len:221 (-) Transcript_134713:1686-2348(-)